MGQLFELIDAADIGLLQDLGRTLGLKMDKVAELQQNARTVAREDSRRRIWGSPEYPADRLVYPCEGGAVDLLREHIGAPPCFPLKSHCGLVWLQGILDGQKCWNLIGHNPHD